MRVVVLTSSPRDFVVECLPQLAKTPGIEIAMIVLSRGQVADPWRARKRQFRKTLRIGVLGALNGIRMRKWYAAPEGRPELPKLARDLGLRLEETPRINCDRTRELFEEANADLGLSLGNA